MAIPHIEIKQDGIVTEVFIDGKKVDGVRKISFEREQSNDVPVLKMEFLASDMKINSTIVPDLPDVLKPFYELKRGNSSI